VITEPEVLGGVEVPAQTLERGRVAYERYCMSCHGERGDGNGVSAPGMWPPPRDFRSAKFKYAGIADRGLPDDAELERILTSGLAGTPMRAWDLSPGELEGVIQYIKTFSPEGKGFRSDRLKIKKPEIPEDPAAANSADSAVLIARGAELYHSMFQCSACHPSYASEQQLVAWEAAPRTGDASAPVPKWSPNYRAVLLPPDFRRDPMRAVRVQDEAGHSAADLYRAVAYGLQGPMPGYGHLGEPEVWAVAHYVKSLADARLESLARPDLPRQ